MNNLKVLIIDDEEDYCLIMRSYFRSKHYEVLIAHTLSDGFKLLEDQRPGVLLLDNNLPDGKGRDQIDRLVEEYPEMKIYFISAYLQKADFVNPPRNVKVWEKPIQLDRFNAEF